MSRTISLGFKAPVNDSLEIVNSVEYAFQPIILMDTLRTHGFEALARMPQTGVCTDIHDLLDDLADNDQLLTGERTLLTNAMTKFVGFGGANAARLFCNVDNRIFNDPRVSPTAIVEIITRLGLEPANICLEISERLPPNSIESMARIVDVFVKHNMRIAIDDFGQGFSGLDTLMRLSPHYLKIDKAFIKGLASSSRQQAIVSKVAGLSHALGVTVVAEGVETEADFRMARDLGCDMAQGYLIARPSTNIADLKSNYTALVTSNPVKQSLPQHIISLMSEETPIHLDAGLQEAVNRFKSGTGKSFLPVIDDNAYVCGAIFEEDLRYFIYGDFGAALLVNRGMDYKVASYIRKCPISDVGAAPDAIVESYVVAGGASGVILTKDGRYYGVLSNLALLRMAAEQDVAAARDQNPLTFLPGNNSISRHLAETVGKGGDRTLAFFDFDNFKAFNDAYGFAVGDRALLMFSDLLMKFRHSCDAFVGHIGGDDFFLSVAADESQTETLCRTLAAKFRTNVESLYLLEDRTNGGLWAKDRFGQTRFLPLLRASVVLLSLPLSRSHLTVMSIVSALADGKSAAKQSADGIAHASLGTTVSRPFVERRAPIALPTAR